MERHLVFFLLFLVVFASSVDTTRRLGRRKRRSKRVLETKKSFNFPFTFEKTCEREDISVTQSGYKSSGWCLMGECALSYAFQSTPGDHFSYLDQHWKCGVPKDLGLLSHDPCTESDHVELGRMESTDINVQHISKECQTWRTEHYPRCTSVEVKVDKYGFQTAKFGDGGSYFAQISTTPYFRFNRKFTKEGVPNSVEFESYDRENAPSASIQEALTGRQFLTCTYTINLYEDDIWVKPGTPIHDEAKKEWNAFIEYLRTDTWHSKIPFRYPSGPPAFHRSYNPQSAMKGDASEFPVIFIDGIWCVVVVARRARMAIESRTHFLNQSITHVTKKKKSNLELLNTPRSNAGTTPNGNRRVRTLTTSLIVC